MLCRFVPNLDIDNVSVDYYESSIKFDEMLDKYGNVTIQTGSELNAVFLRSGLIDKVHLVMTPIIVGGRHTPTLVGGADVEITEELNDYLQYLELEYVKPLEHSFV